MLHVLIHMDGRERPLTSGEISRILDTNPVVVRRIMAGLRDKGLVTSEKGHGGGWQLARSLGQVTLLNVYEAIGSPPVFALGLADDQPECLVEQAVNAGLDDAFRSARETLLDRFGNVTLADLATDFEKRLKNHRREVAVAERQSGLG
jgi:Rrf2 family protein